MMYSRLLLASSSLCKARCKLSLAPPDPPPARLYSLTGFNPNPETEKNLDNQFFPTFLSSTSASPTPCRLLGRGFSPLLSIAISPCPNCKLPIPIRSGSRILPFPLSPSLRTLVAPKSGGTVQIEVELSTLLSNFCEGSCLNRERTEGE